MIMGVVEEAIAAAAAARRLHTLIASRIDPDLLRRFDANPTDPRTQAAVADALADTDFATAVEPLLPVRVVNTQTVGELRGASLQGNTVSMDRSLVAGGNIDKSRRSVRIGVGGFFAVLLLFSAGTVGYQIDREPSGTPFFAGATLDDAAALAVLPDVDSVPSGWRVLDGYPRRAPCPDGCEVGVEAVYQGAVDFDSSASSCVPSPTPRRRRRATRP